MTTIRLIVGDQFGRRLDELECDIGPVSWRMNDIGRAKFTIAANDSKATKTNLHFGNRVLLQFSNGLPDWGGVIDPPRKWGAEGSIEFTAYSGEYLLGLRQTDKGRYFNGASVGEIFTRIIGEANSIYGTGLTVGEVWMGGDGHSPEYHYHLLLEIVQKSLCGRLSAAEFNVTASADAAGQIVFTANLYEQMGRAKTNVALIEGHNATEVELTEQGPIVNSWDVAGEGSDWGDTRLTGKEEDTTSIALYGLRQGSQIYSDVSVQETLDMHAATALAKSKDPYNIVVLKAANLAPGLFASYGLGDTIRVTLPSYGFGGYDHMARVLGREFDPATGLCSLIVREAD